ncbi:protein of unknown function [Salegentibacter echinorum]|uniref:3-keto-alpha-glucoside-1,2-lyase/3-keto-2-hydroxy-glucal hydratase domain-containing protein n=1 Tax=Salegentibacter echinorum TaxID=1073325 RepID=A0A1M5GHC0_SALEC|nr:DUF1080 domain-containing protein [Salegentibacter echinorum]SHG02901.1 protein of unknown function [Salegentibacter echinorum]
MKKRIPFSVILIIFTSFIFLGCSSKSSNQWEPLFNGENLDDWQIKIRKHELGDNFGNTFRVNDGLLQIRYDQYENGFEEKYGHLFYKKPFSTYLLGVEYRFVGDQVKNGPGWAYRNNGIMIHGQKPETMEKDQDFPNSIEVQLLGGNGKEERSNANVCTPGTQFVKDGKLITTHCTNSNSKTFPGDQWVRVDVLAVRDSLIVHYVNGEEVLRYNKPQKDDETLLTGGTISLQSESHPTDFRKVEIVDLEKYADDPKALQAQVDKLLNEKN